MAGKQSVTFDFLSRGADSLGRDFKSTGDSAALAAKGARLLADSLEKERKAADVSAGATLALAKADKILDDAEHTLADGALEAEFALKREAAAARDAGRAGAESAAGSKAAGAGFSGMLTPMSGAVGAGVALAPVLVTLGVGLAGVGAAAAGTIMPIEKAASKTGGLRANLGTLDSEQRRVAVSILGLGKEYSAFQKALEPEVIGIFNQGIKIAGHLMRDVQPVAAATGKAFGGFLGQLDQTFASGEFRQFFGFMASTAAPDMRLLGTTIIDVTKDLPPLLEELQPAGQGFLRMADGVAKAAGGVIGFTNSWENSPFGTRRELSMSRGVDAATLSFTDRFIPGATQVNHALTNVQHAGWNVVHALSFGAIAAHGAGSALSAAGKKTGAFATAEHLGAIKVTEMVSAVNAEQTAVNALNSLLGVQSAQDAWKTAVHDMTAALKANNGTLDINTVKGRTDRDMVIASSQAAETLATKQLHMRDGAAKASGTLQTQIGVLEGLHSKSKLVKDEIDALKRALNNLHSRDIGIIVTGRGSFYVRPGGAVVHRHTAAGWLVSGGTPGRDSVPIMAMPGEAVVPKRLVPAVAPFLKANAVPGFAGGGIVGQYRGGVPGLGRWARHDYGAFTTSLEQAVARGLKQAMAAAAAISGGGGPAAALFRQMYPAWASGAMWAATNYVAMKESGWNTYAANPTSNARGIWQKISGWSADYPPGNAYLQNIWGHNYMQSRYGGPIGAAIHESSQGWYGNGLHAIISRPTLIGVGERGTERVDVYPQQAGARGGGSGMVKVVIGFAPPTAGFDNRLGHALIEYLRNFVRISGGDVQRTLGQR